MATPEIAPSCEDSIYRSTGDVKVPTTLELPVDDWPQEVTDILSPDLIIGETDSSARQLGHGNGTVGIITSSTPMVAPDLSIGESDSSARQFGHDNGTDGIITSSAPMVAPSTNTSTNLPATAEASLHNPPDDSLPSTAENPDLINGETDSWTSQLGHENGTVGIITSSTPMVAPSTKTSMDLLVTTAASLNSAPDDSHSSTTEDSLLLTPETSLSSTPDIGFPKTQAALSPNNDSTMCEKPVEKLALRILDIIQRYGHSTGSGTGVDWAGKNKFLPLVEQSIQKNEAVKMVLPAFPCKSVNKVDKVLGVLPDLGEELALMHLNGLCESIAEIYEHGAELVITSDGLVYNDILGISDTDVWDYSTAIRDIIKAKQLRYISTLRIVDLLSHARTAELTKEEYLAHAGCYRRELIAKYAPKDLDLRGAIRSEVDTCMTYTGYVKFLLKDLRHSALAKDALGQKISGEKYKVAVKKIALAMIERGKTFAAAIEANCKDHVRLSIHQSSGQTKLSIPLIPQPGKGNLMTPWHCAIAVGLDGSFKTVHAADVRDTHEVVLQNGHPHHLREKSDLWNFGDVKVEFEHLYPCGLIVRPAVGADPASPPSFRDIDVLKVRKLAELQSPVILRGFADTMDRELYIKKAGEMGEILPWMFGQLMVVKDQKKVDRGSNNVASNEAMPMHYDGIFKFRTKKDDDGNVMRDEEGNEIQIQIPPRFQLFSAIATAPKGSGYTLFAESRLFFQYLPAPYTLSRLQAVKWRLLSIGYWRGKMQNMSLVVPHPVTSVPCLRWHESWPESKTKYSTCEVKIENDDQEIVDMVDRLMYDRRVCLRFGWEWGDILLADNSSMMHTRTAFTDDCERELWRIHLDEMQINLCNDE